MEQQPGKGAATASLVLGIISLIGLLISWIPFISLISIGCGIAGIICSASAKKAGFVGGIRTAGLVMSIIGLIIGCIGFVSCTLCVICLGAASLAAQDTLSNYNVNDIQDILNQFGY